MHPPLADIDSKAEGCVRCHYLSDLHLEAQDYQASLPRGEVLIIAGDLCHARCLHPASTDKYAVNQRARVSRFIDTALSRFAHVLLVLGNHEHYDGIFDETATLLTEMLPGVTVLDDVGMEISGVSFFGMTLWTDFNKRDRACMDHVRRKCGEFFFVKKRMHTPDGTDVLGRFQPEDALAAFNRSWFLLTQRLERSSGKPSVVVSHFPPSLSGLNPLHTGNGLDGAFASDLDDEIMRWPHLVAWVHGHTHIRKTYSIGDTTLYSNCRGFVGKDASARDFLGPAFFDVQG